MKTLTLSFCLLSVGLPALSGVVCGAETPAAASPVLLADTATPNAIKHRLLSEIADLEDKRRRQSEQYREQTLAIEQAHHAVEAAQRVYNADSEKFGAQSAQAATDERQLAVATKALYERVSAREHIRYQLQSLDQGIKQRRLSLSYQEGSRDVSVWR